MKDRNSYIDFLKGVSIFMVVGVHTFNRTTDMLSISIREILTIAVPIFLAISGYLLANKDLNNDKKYIFWRKQIPKIYIPTLIWSLPFFCRSIFVGNSILMSSLTLFLCGYSIFYYIAVQCQMYILLPYIQKRQVWGVIAITLLTLFFISYLNRLFNIINIHPLISENLCFEWLFFFYIGVRLKKSELIYSIKIPSLLIICGCILSIIETKMFINNGIMAFTANKFSCYIMSTGFILLLFSSKLMSINIDGAIVNLFVKLGKISFPIYLSHCLIILVLELLHFRSMWLIDWVVVVALDTFFILLLKRFIPLSLYKYIGFV